MSEIPNPVAPVFYPDPGPSEAINSDPPAQPKTGGDVAETAPVVPAMLPEEITLGKREGAKWIPVSERLPKIGDPEYDGPCDGVEVLFLHDGSVYSGWPVYPPDQWEMSEGGMGIFSGVTHWMRKPPLVDEACGEEKR